MLIVLMALIFRLLSAAWSAIKHFEFTLTGRGEELFQSYGLLTRVGRTIPRSRIQKLTISEAPLMRLLGRATVTVDTAASVSERHKQQAAQGGPRARADRAGVAARRADPRACIPRARRRARSRRARTGRASTHGRSAGWCG